MSTSFKVNIQSLRNTESNLNDIEASIQTIYDSISKEKNGLSFQIGGSRAIRSRLKNTMNAVSAEKDKVKKMHSIMESVANEYEKTENEICSACQDGMMTLRDRIEGDIDLTSGVKFDTSDLNDQTKKKKKWDGNGYYKDGKKIDEKNAPTFYEKEATILEVAGEWKVENIKDENKIYIGNDGTIKYEEGKTEAHASISGGLYVVGADGEKKFSPGIDAEIGASATVLDIEYDQQWFGDDNLGLNTEIDVTLLKAEGKGDINFQWYDENGNWDFQAEGGISAEFIAAEVEGTATLNILGTEVEATGGISVGFGAHAEVGYNDGVFKVDIGASLGIGFSANIEVDVGGMVDTVVDSAQAVWDGAKSLWNSLFN